MTQDPTDTQSTVDEVLFDGRSLQHHARESSRLADFDLALLAAIRHRDWPTARPRLVCLVDPTAEPLREHHRLLFDEITSGRHRTGRQSRCFISSVPMVHDPVWVLPILLDPRILKVAAVHERVSLEGPPGYRSALERRADHLIGLAWLGRYDLFAVGSQAVKAELEQFRAIEPSRVVIAGRAVSSEFEPNPADLPTPFGDRRHVVVAVGSGEREDLEGVLAAHARSGMRRRYPLLVIGSCSPDLRAGLRTHYGRKGGSQDELTFVDGLPDGDIRNPYRDALLTVVPSLGSEALISSALESAALGTPVAVPQPEGQADLASIAAFRYMRGDCDALARLLDATAGDASFWEEVRAAGVREARLHSTDAAVRRLLDAVIERTAHPSAPAVIHGARPRLALLSPLPPESSGAATRSAATIEALSRYVDVRPFSDTPGALSLRDVQPIAPVHAAELGLQQFDASLSVLGNSRHHAAVLEHVLANGGAALTHDAHLVGLYAATFGLDRALDVGRVERGGDLSQDEVAEWTREPRDMPVLFMSEVARAAAPLLVTSDLAKREIGRLYGIKPKRLPPLQHRTFDAALLTKDQRRIRRDALGWNGDEVVVCSFGLGFAETAVVVWALRLLHDWRLDARLALCGLHNDGDWARIACLSQELELGPWITRSPDGPSSRAYADHLVAADMAVQLGTHPFSGPSEAVMYCIAASLPTIANDHVASTVEAPSFVRRVPDALSPVLVAEAALDIVSSGQHRMRPIKETRAFAEAHSPDLYARAMMEALGLDGGKG